MSTIVTPDEARRLDLLTRNPSLLEVRGRKTLCERRLIDFMEFYWPVLHPGKQIRRGWALEAICEHLEAVTRGEIRHLLINVPPGFSKSMATNVFWPAWEWGPMNMPHLQYLSAAYSDSLTQRDNERCRALMGHDTYATCWGDRFSFDKNMDGRVKFMNDKRGHKEATSVKGLATGGRGDRLICDDPHNVLAAESDAIRMETLKWFTEAWPTRTNDENAAFIVIMQRVHEADVSAACIELGFTHLCIPMRWEEDHPHRWFGGGFIAHEPVRKAVEEIEVKALEVGEPLTRQQAYEKFIAGPGADEIVLQPGYVTDNDTTQVSHAPQHGGGDPRREEDALAFEELFGQRRVREMERKMALNDPLYAWAGQMQQRPSPRGGGQIKDDCIIYVNAADVPVGGKTHVECGWDLAGSKGRTSPFTVKVKGKYGPDGCLYILGVVRKRVEADELDKHVLVEMEADGRGVRHNLPQDPGQAGKYQKRAMSSKFRGHWFVFSPETGDKITRAQPVISQFGSKNVRIVRGPWNKDYVSDMKKFPAGRYRDCMDATSRMDMGLTQSKGTRRARLTTQGVRKDTDMYGEEADSGDQKEQRRRRMLP